MKEAFEVRLAPDRVAALRGLARKLAFERDVEVTWSDLVREGIEIILEKNAAAPQGATS
jgi:hypothetical protein